MSSDSTISAPAHDPCLDQALARRILDRVGSTGQPPERGAGLVNVGTDEILDVLRHEYLIPIRERVGNSTFKLVQAPFGGGKTHFLHCLRETAWQEGFATAIVGLSPKECPFDQPRSIYREVAQRIEYPPSSLEAEPAQGLEALLKDVATEKIADNGADAFRDWIETEFRDLGVESRSFHRAVAEYFEALVDGQRDAQELLGDYLHGEELSKEDRWRFKLREVFDDKVAFKWLRSLAQCLHALDLPGVVFMFDEMDRNMSLPTKRRQAIGDNLRQMIDYCGQSYLPGVVWCYAVPPEFMDTVVPEYPALAQRLKGPTQFGATSHMQPIIDLDQLPLGSEALFRGIGHKLYELAGIAFDHRFDDAIQDTNLRRLSRVMEEQSLESGTRRRFVKAAASMIESQRREGERELDDREVRALCGGSEAAADTMSSMPDEEIF